jgi:hypothetical protein
MGQEVRLVAFEGHRVVPPDQRRERQRLIQDREVRGTVPAGQIAFGQGEREGRIRGVANQASVELEDRRRTIDPIARPRDT